MAFWNRNDDYRRREQQREPRRDEEQYGSPVREVGYGENLGVPTERGPNDRGEWARDRYGMAERPRDDRYGQSRTEPDRDYQGRPMSPRDTGEPVRYVSMDPPQHRPDFPNNDLRSGPNSRYDYRMDDRRYRSDMPGMGSRGDYGMDDSRQREDWGRDYGRSGMSYEAQVQDSRNGPYGTAERQMGGRGPKSYSRSDDRIREDICERLMQSWLNAEDVDVRVEKGEVTLTGEADSRIEKRGIEDTAANVLGVKDVHNQIRVRTAITARDSSEQRQRVGITTDASLTSATARSSSTNTQESARSTEMSTRNNQESATRSTTDTTPRTGSTIPAGAATVGGNGTPVRS